MNHYRAYCLQLQATQKYRCLPHDPDARLDFASNDYLNLSKSQALIEAAHRAACQWGVGSTGSRLLSGNTGCVERFEARIAADKHSEAALIFNSGYQANVTVLSALCDPSVLGSQALLFFDKLNHASLYQGAALSGAALKRYRHNDMVHLESLLQAHQTDSRPKWIVAETLYGMDGDVVDLPALIALAKAYDAGLYLDEAHATGLLGPQGYGLSTAYDLSELPCVVMGTFSKAVGVCGAYIACSQSMKEYLINRAAGFIYSTALSPMVIGAAEAGWQAIATLREERHALLERAAWLRAECARLGFDIGASSTHILPIILGKEGAVLAAHAHLLEQGIRTSAIRPPTVPPGKARLRIALRLDHEPLHLEQLLEALRTV